MTAAFDALIAAGSGALEFRLVIEGARRIWVTAEAMAGTQSDDRVRVPGLRYDGLGFTERVYIAGAEHDAQINSVTIEEMSGAWLGAATEEFTTIAERICDLALTLDTTDPGTAKVPAGNGAVFTSGNRYHVGTECVKVTAIDATPVDPLPDELTIDRGEWDTAAQEHPSSVGEAAQVSALYDNPTGFSGRRCWLYAHTPSELAVASEGTIVWRGVLSREPALVDDDGLAWSLAIEPRTRALEASLAGGFDQPLKLRGIYYPGERPLTLYVSRMSTAAAFTGTPTSVTVKLAGFWETQEAFCTALDAKLNGDATISSWGVRFTVRPFADTWDLLVTIDVTPLYIQVTAGSDIDGQFDGYLQADPAVAAGIEVPGDDAAGAVFSVSASTTYRCKRSATFTGLVPAEEMRRVPRSNNAGHGTASTTADVASFPATRLYLTRIGALVSGDDLLVSPPTVDETGAPGEELPAQILRIASVSASTNSVISSEGGDASRPPRIIASGGFCPAITGAARYASGDGDVADLRDDLISRAPTVANRGRGPWVTSDDLASWTTAAEEAASGRSFLAHRVYTFGKPVKAIEVLREEWKLAGLIPYLDASAKLAVRQFTLGGNGDPVIEIGADQHLVDGGQGTVTGEADGLVTVVHALTGYDPAEDEHSGGDIIYRGLSAIARVKEERVLEIAPRSRAVGAEPTWEDLSERARSLIALFGDRRTQVVKIDVTLECFDVLIGDGLTLTIPALPSDGARTEWTPGSGMIDRGGILIGREWDLSEGAGQFEVLLHELELAGYAPSCRVTGAAGATTTWTLTVTQNHYAPTGINDTSFFAVGQAIRLIEWDSATPNTEEGTITALTATTVDVTITSWGGMGGATYYTLVPDTSDDADTAAAQLAYMYQGSATGRIPLASGSRTPRVYAP